jgi:hypothetical protein
MTGAKWLVVLGGIAVIVWINWYFFFAPTRGARAGAPKPP